MMDKEEFLEEFVTDDVREKAREELNRMFREKEEQWSELKHEADHSVMLDEDMEE